jgi:hypothetical protein
MMKEKSIAMVDSTMVAGTEGTVHIRMGIALQCAPLTAIIMPEKCGAIMVWMRMDAGWVTIAQLLIATQLQPLVQRPLVLQPLVLRPLVLQPLVLQAQPPRENDGFNTWIFQTPFKDKLSY